MLTHSKQPHSEWLLKAKEKFPTPICPDNERKACKVLPLNPSKDNTLEIFWWVWITQTSILHSKIETCVIYSRCHTAAGKLKPVVLFSMQPNSYCIWNFLTNELMLLVLRPAQFSFFSTVTIHKQLFHGNHTSELMTLHLWWTKLTKPFYNYFHLSCILIFFILIIKYFKEIIEKDVGL